MSAGQSVEAAGPDDLEAIRTMNNAAVPAVNALGSDELVQLAAMGALRLVRRADGGVAAAVLTLTTGCPYDSLNYRWFGERFDAFLYVDRVVVDAASRGSGLGRTLYDDAIARAMTLGLPRVCAEVNVDPPNPNSMAFHLAMGFRPIHQRRNERDGKVVAMMERPL